MVKIEIKNRNGIQKVDKDTIDVIDRMRMYLFSIGIRTSKERAWDILYNAHKIPYDVLREKNPTIKYQGKGYHVSSKNHGDQLMMIRDLGKYVLQGVSSKSSIKKRAAVKFKPSEKISKIFKDVEVKE